MQIAIQAAGRRKLETAIFSRGQYQHHDVLRDSLAIHTTTDSIENVYESRTFMNGCLILCDSELLRGQKGEDVINTGKVTTRVFTQVYSCS